MKKNTKSNSIIVICTMILTLCGVLGLVNSFDFKSNQVDETYNHDFSNMTMGCLGDSITKGARVNNPYPKLLQNELNFERVYNYGYSGSTITNSNDGKSMVERSLTMAKDLDIIMVMGGVNDYIKNMELGVYTDKTTETFYGSLKCLIETLQTKYDDSFIFFSTPYKTRYKTDKNECGYVLKDYVNAILNICSDYQIPVLDSYTNGQLESDYSLYTFDDLHPTQLFYDEYTCPQIITFINEIYKA